MFFVSTRQLNEHGNGLGPHEWVERAERNRVIPGFCQVIWVEHMYAICVSCIHNFMIFGCLREFFEWKREVHLAACHARAACSGGEVVVPSIEAGSVHHVANEFAPVVVVEYVVAGGTLPRERAGSRAAQRVVLVCAAG